MSKKPQYYVTGGIHPVTLQRAVQLLQDEGFDIDDIESPDVERLVSSLLIIAEAKRRDDKGRLEELLTVAKELAKSATRQPAGVVVDDAMVERAMAASVGGYTVRECWFAGPKWSHELMRAALQAALGGGGGGAGVMDAKVSRTLPQCPQ